MTLISHDLTPAIPPTVGGAMPGGATRGGHVVGLRCRNCQRAEAVGPAYVCSACFGPLEVVYDYDVARRALRKDRIAARPAGIWRYLELLPVDAPPARGLAVGSTPLVQADRLGSSLSLDRLWLKDDTRNPTLSFKDRVVAVALSKAREFGFTTVGCASTGNLANSVAANAAAAGLDACILVPADLESSKILGTSVYGARLIGVQGTYDQVNRLCTQIALKYGWGFVNVNLRAYYAEGSKSMGFEIAEQLGWRVPQHVVVPMAGGSLIGKIHKAFHELARIGLIGDPTCKIHGAQATGCNPISHAVKNNLEAHQPVQKPQTIAKSLAIGDPADGYFACKVIRGSGGWAEDVSDDEIAEAMLLLARTEGVFAETAGGVTVAVARKLIEQGRIGRDEEVVLCITGNGLKTQDAVANRVEKPAVIKPSFKAFEELVQGKREAVLV